MKKSLFLFLYLLNSLVFAQTNLTNGSKNLVGYVVDENKIPFPGVSIRLFSADSVLITNTVTNDKGFFELKAGPASPSFVIISYMGYKKLTINLTSSSPFPESFVLQEDLKMLKQVIISGKLPLIHQKMDRTVITINDQVKKIADNALDIVKIAPGMTVSDNDDEILMSGKESVNVMLNHKLIRLSGRDLVKLLKSLPVNTLSQLEVMTNPSAKYEVSGNTGLLNILTKSAVVKGLRGNIDLSHTQARHGMGDLSANLNYGSAKFAVNPYFAYHYGNYPTFSTSNQTLKNALLKQNSTDKDKWSDPATQVTAEYYLSSKQTLGALFSYEVSQNKQNYQTSSLLERPLLSDTSYLTNGFGPNWRHWATYNLNYRFADTLGTEFSLDLDRSIYHKDDERNVSNLIGNSNVLNNTRYQTLTDITVNTIKADYTHNWTNKLKLEAGFKLSGISTNNNLSFNTSKTQQNNNFLYKEHVNAAYFNLAKTYKKWGIQLGARIEHSKVKGTFTDPENSLVIKPDSSYLNVLPAIYLTYQPYTTHKFRLSFNQYIKRPNYNALQPFTYQTDPFNYQTGNPELRVQKNSNAEFSYTYNDRLTLTSAYTHTTDYFNPVTYLVGNSLYQSMLNSGTMDNWNFDLNYPVKLNKWWSMLNKLSIFYNHFKGQLYQGLLDDGKWSYWISTSQRFNLPDKYAIVLSARYNSPVQNLIYYKQGFGNMGFSLSKKIWKEQASFKIAVSDLFKMQRSNTSVNFGDLIYTQNKDWESRRISIGFTWHFGNEKIKETQERSTGSQNEKSRSL